MSNVFLISDAAKKVAVESHVLRYWEEELGLPIKRNELGHRYYTDDDIRKFQEIRDLKEKGLQLKAIRMVLKNGKLDVLTPQEEKKTFGSARSVSQPDVNVKNQSQRKESQRSVLDRNVSAKSELPRKELQINESIECGDESVFPLDTELMKQEQQMPYAESREEKAARLQWLLQQLFRDTLQENNAKLCKEMKESVVKELDYQFRMQEEREEERSTENIKRDEEHFKKIDDLLRKKRGLLKKKD
ncbi:MAG TPA: helix-turn-helix domain-containing protein [Lachnospiraceae bacterium]|nr:helix-turn-helix domain-containing protein [Lachnospiraceae bacterium]